MADEVEQLVIGVRADTRGFSQDVAAMRGELTGPLAEGAGRAGQMIERSLVRALVNGRLGFDQLKKIALGAMAEIAAASLRALIQPSGGGAGAGTGGLLAGLVNAIAGAPGRATGGPVSGGRPYIVGERGPELFVPGHSGRIERIGQGGSRDVRVGITVTHPRAEDPRVLRQSSRQVASAVRNAIRNAR